MRHFSVFSLFALLLLNGCYSGPKVISSYKYFGDATEPKPADNFELKVDTALLASEIPGKYVYLINPDSANITVTIDRNSAFSATYWPGHSPEKKNIGNWQYQNNVLKLKTKGIFNRAYTLLPYRVGPLVFLVPESKQKNFAAIINANKAQIEYVSSNYDRLRTMDILQQLQFLRGHCLIKEKLL